MRLPGGDRAVVDNRKIVDYLLSPEHPVGRHKAKVFESALGLTLESAAVLEAALRRAAADGEAEFVRADRFGERFQIDFTMTHAGRSGTVRSAWLASSSEPPVLITAYVL